MSKFKFKLKEVLKPKDVNPALIDRLNQRYGEVDMENDFFNDDLTTYFKFSGEDSETGTKEHDVIPLASFADSLKELSQALKSLTSLAKTKDGKADPKISEISEKLRGVFNMFRTHIRKNYPDQYEAIKSSLEEISSTGGGAGAASFTPGTGAQYATPYAFSGKKKGKYDKGGMYTKKFGYKLVPDKIKGSGLEAKKLFEEETGDKKKHSNKKELLHLM